MWEIWTMLHCNWCWPQLNYRSINTFSTFIFLFCIFHLVFRKLTCKISSPSTKRKLSARALTDSLKAPFIPLSTSPELSKSMSFDCTIPFTLFSSSFKGKASSFTLCRLQDFVLPLWAILLQSLHIYMSPHSRQWCEEGFFSHFWQLFRLSSELSTSRSSRDDLALGWALSAIFASGFENDASNSAIFKPF